MPYDRKTPYYLECEKSDDIYKQKAKKSCNPIKYTCHAGLVEVICPVEINNEVIGYIQCGKFVDKEKKFSSAAKVKAVAQKYGINERELLSCYKDLPVVTAKKLNSTLYLLEKFIKPLIVTLISDENHRARGKKQSSDFGAQLRLRQYFQTDHRRRHLQKSVHRKAEIIRYVKKRFRSVD